MQADKEEEQLIILPSRKASGSQQYLAHQDIPSGAIVLIAQG